MLRAVHRVCEDMSKKGTKRPTMHTKGLTDLKLKKVDVRVSSLVQATVKTLSIQARDSGMRPKIVGNDAQRHFPGVCLHLKTQLRVMGIFHKTETQRSHLSVEQSKVTEIFHIFIKNETTQYQPYPATPLCYICSSTLTWTKLTRTTPPHTAPAFPTMCHIMPPRDRYDHDMPWTLRTPTDLPLRLNSHETPPCDGNWHRQHSNHRSRSSRDSHNASRGTWLWPQSTSIDECE